MEISRNEFKMMVEACECYYRIYDALECLSGRGLEGEGVYEISNILYVTRGLGKS